MSNETIPLRILRVRSIPGYVAPHPERHCERISPTESVLVAVDRPESEWHADDPDVMQLVNAAYIQLETDDQQAFCGMIREAHCDRLGTVRIRVMELTDRMTRIPAPLDTERRSD